MCTGILRAACARAVSRLRRLRGSGPAAASAARGHRPALPFSAAPCGALALRQAGRHVSRLRCTTGARWARRAPQQSWDAGLPPSRSGLAAQWRARMTSGNPPARRSFFAVRFSARPAARMTSGKPPARRLCGPDRLRRVCPGWMRPAAGSPASDRAGPTARRRKRRGIRCAPALSADKTTLRGGALRRGRGTVPANCGSRCATLRAGLVRRQIATVPE